MSVTNQENFARKRSHLSARSKAAVGLTSILSKVLNRFLLSRPNRPETLTRALVYSPNLGGHRHIYSKKIVDALESLGLEVVFVYCGILTDGRRDFAPISSPHVAELENRKEVHAINVSDRLTRDTDELALIVELQREHNIDYTLFIDGDALTSIFLSQMKPRRPKLLGRNCAIFILSEFLHIASLKWRQYRIPARRPDLNRKLFHLFLFKHLNLLDFGLYSDEYVVQRAKSKKYVHLPEVGHAPVKSELSPEMARLLKSAMQSYKDFLGRHPDKEVILCFGDLEARKGYDFLVRLVEENPDLVLARVGRIKPSYRHTWDTVLKREHLLREDRIFEFEHYINDQEFIDTLFQSINFLLLPYKAFYRTSSVMTQAMSYTLPLLVSHVGLMRQRVEKDRLGRFFRDQNYDSFVEEFKLLRSDHASYTDSIRACYEREYAPEAIESALAETLE